MLDNNGTEEQKEITTGLDDGARTEVLSGLSEGDKVTISMTTTNKTTTTNMQVVWEGLAVSGVIQQCRADSTIERVVLEIHVRVPLEVVNSDHF
ncbi:hypothetical protein [Paenibacillus macquariensis]|uniref:Multidrug resistance protein MdtA-like C-terminal permuted SH3 domain-containing protein n=1 Tax=Paenibacillus macquariensis TaxID=948756 RepID=A0ABY1JNF9_9BACL|nr:hypothetical protein [Paenibacillus macquariensis]MEC0092166.1 hypothetical protein [Paenibacillus macquariensis]OAB37282.1 hypothetical protein PMSM_04195 [Paenibacillus macquariensis subsp. macquariensis]SIQ49844.1 hypothetical protein SAMN05421578_102263 [Paenibacillus macquariensis]